MFLSAQTDYINFSNEAAMNEKVLNMYRGLIKEARKKMQMFSPNSWQWNSYGMDIIFWIKQIRAAENGR